MGRRTPDVVAVLHCTGRVEAYTYKDVGEFHIHRVEDGHVFLWAFEIYPQYRRRGHARAMLREAIRLAGHDLELFVKQDNMAAIELYRGSGFEIVGVNDNAHDYLMRRKAEG